MVVFSYYAGEHMVKKHIDEFYEPLHYIFQNNYVPKIEDPAK